MAVFQNFTWSILKYFFPYYHNAIDINVNSSKQLSGDLLNYFFKGYRNSSSATFSYGDLTLYVMFSAIWYHL